MIDNIHIANFRGFKDLSIDSFKRVNLVVGANNSGKTSLLEAILLLAATEKTEGLASVLMDRGQIISDAWEWRNHRALSGQIPSNQIDGYLVQELFHGRRLNGKQLRIASESPRSSVTIDVGQEHEKTDSKLTIHSERTDGTHSDDSLEVVDGVVQGSPRFRISRKGPGSVRFLATDGIDFTWMAAAWDRIVLKPQEEKVLEALRLLEPRIERINFSSGRSSASGVLVKLKDEDTPISLDGLGDGIRRILAISIALADVGTGTLLVDEIDTGLYYATLADMWRVVTESAAKQGAQIFATTHSWDCVEAFQQALKKSAHRDDGRLLRLDRVDGRVKCTAYSVDELDIAVAQRIEVR